MKRGESTLKVFVTEKALRIIRHHPQNAKYSIVTAYANNNYVFYHSKFHGLS